MKAAVVAEKGVEVRELPKPQPAPHEVLIRVRAVSLNRADLGVAAGHMHGKVGGVGSRIGLECRQPTTVLATSLPACPNRHFIAFF